MMDIVVAIIILVLSVVFVVVAFCVVVSCVAFARFLEGLENELAKSGKPAKVPFDPWEELGE